MLSTPQVLRDVDEFAGETAVGGRFSWVHFPATCAGAQVDPTPYTLSTS